MFILYVIKYTNKVKKDSYKSLVKDIEPKHKIAELENANFTPKLISRLTSDCNCSLCTFKLLNSIWSIMALSRNFFPIKLKSFHLFRESIVINLLYHELVYIIN